MDNSPPKITCNECGGDVKPSKALVNPLCGTRDGTGTTLIAGATLSPSSEAVIKDCLKCQECGHSFIIPKSLNQP
jgi:hypothetical protein